MGHLDTLVRYDTLVARGALDLYDERLIRRWMRGRDAITVAEALEVRAPAAIVFWAVLREYLVGAPVLHQLALDVAGEYLQRSRATHGTYIDFRTERALDAKQAWIDRRISDGELVVAATRAGQAALDVALHGDPQVWAIAHIVCQSLTFEPDDAVTQTYYSFIETFAGPDDNAWLIAQAGKRLAE
jgi:hypothetical protein